MLPSGAAAGPSVNPPLIFAVRVNKSSSLASGATMVSPVGGGTSAANAGTANTRPRRASTVHRMVGLLNCERENEVARLKHNGRRGAMPLLRPVVNVERAANNRSSSCILQPSSFRPLFVETHSLTKRYGPFAALADCSLRVEQGEVFGLLGPNGAGKTTLLRLLLGYLRPTSGHATIDGLDCYRQSVAVHRRLAYLPGDARLFRQLNGRQTLEFFSRLRESAPLARALQLAERLQLDLTRKVRQMSTGMRQKLALAIALTPDVPL